MDETGSIDQGMTPTLRERVSSTAVTVVAGLLAGAAATIVLGIVVWFLQVVLGIKVPLEIIFNGGATELRPSAMPDSPAATATSLLLWTLVVLVVWLTVCRAGIGTPGDAVMTLRACDGSGAAASRGRNLLRGAVPVGLLAVVAQLAGSGWALVALAALWAPALVRADRRTAVDLLVGVVPRSLAPAKTGRSWPVQAADETAPRA
jgi:hypothetical protein